MRLDPFPLLLATTNRVARSSIFVFDNKDSIRVGVIQKNNASKRLFGTCAEADSLFQFTDIDRSERHSGQGETARR
jgi:hypothetical protein